MAENQGEPDRFVHTSVEESGTEIVATKTRQDTIHHPDDDTEIITETNKFDRTCLVDNNVSAKTKIKVRVGDCIKNRFELVKILGIGGMGVVYQARDLRQKELGEAEPYLALKVLNDQLSCNESALVALQQEWKKTQQLAHPNIVTVYDFDRDRDLVFISMELLQGQSLDEIIFEPGFSGLGLREIRPWIQAIGEALAFAHENRIIHSDFKPSNLFLTDKGTIKIFDFGISRAMHGDHVPSSSRENSLAALTPAYASVGMLKGRPPQPSDDIYAFAIVIYLLLTGRHPYHRKTATEAQRLRLVPPRPTQLNDKAWKGLRLALDPRACEQFTARQFLAFILPAPMSLSKRQRVGLSVLAVLVLLGFGVWLWRSITDANVIARLAANDVALIADTLTQIDTMSVSRKRYILNESRVPLIRHVLEQSQHLIAAGEFAAAIGYSERFLEIYPDSQQLWDLHQAITKQGTEVLQKINRRLSLLENELLSFSPQQSQDWLRLLLRLQAVAPNHQRLTTEPLLAKVRTQVSSLLYRGHTTTAMQVLQGTKHFNLPDNSVTDLVKLTNRYQSAATRQVHQGTQTDAFTTLTKSSNYHLERSDHLQQLKQWYQGFQRDQLTIQQVQTFLEQLAKQDPQLAKEIRQAAATYMKFTGQHNSGNEKERTKPYTLWHKAFILESDGQVAN